MLNSETVALLCEAGPLRFAVAADLVDQLLEFELTGPLPLASRPVIGLGCARGKLLIVLGLVPGPAESCRAIETGVLLSDPSDSLGWVVQVTRASTFVRVAADVQRLSDAHSPWLLPVRDLDTGEPLVMLDVQRIFSGLKDRV